MIKAILSKNKNNSKKKKEENDVYLFFLCQSLTESTNNYCYFKCFHSS
jgi:hypothetical protein